MRGVAFAVLGLILCTTLTKEARAAGDTCTTGVDIVVAHDLPFPHIDDITCASPCTAGCRKKLQSSPHGDVYTCVCKQGGPGGDCDLGVTVPGGRIVKIGRCPESCRIRLRILSFRPFRSRAVLRCR